MHFDTGNCRDNLYVKLQINDVFFDVDAIQSYLHLLLSYMLQFAAGPVRCPFGVHLHLHCKQVPLRISSSKKDAVLVHLAERGEVFA